MHPQIKQQKNHKYHGFFLQWQEQPNRYGIDPCFSGQITFIAPILWFNHIDRKHLKSFVGIPVPKKSLVSSPGNQVHRKDVS